MLSAFISTYVFVIHNTNLNFTVLSFTFPFSSTISVLCSQYTFSKMHWFLTNILPILATLTATSLAGTVAPRASFQPVTIKGNAFFAGNDRFYVRGVDYQPGMSIALFYDSTVDAKR